MYTIRLAALSAVFAIGATCVQAQPASSDFTWSGAYFGLNAGGAFDSGTRFDHTGGFLANNNTALTLGLRPTEHRVRNNGVLGGGQVGYNFDSNMLGMSGDMWSRVVMGLEADAAYTDLDQTDTVSNTTNYGPLDTPSATPFTRVNQYNSELKYLGTVRGRLGMAFDTMLIYGTGGLAYGDVRRGVTFYGPNAPTTPFFTGTNNGMKAGYTYGGGVEFAIPQNSFLNAFNFFNSSAVTLKAEFLHYELGDNLLTFPGVNGGATIGGYTARVIDRGNLARAGINYKL